LSSVTFMKASGSNKTEANYGAQLTLSIGVIHG
jgi:hypothetical protein